MAAELTRLTHEIALQLHLVAESCTTCSSRSRRPVRKLLDTPSDDDGVCTVPELHANNRFVSVTYKLNLFPLSVTIIEVNKSGLSQPV
jgi:hypothetical protein